MRKAFFLFALLSIVPGLAIVGSPARGQAGAGPLGEAVIDDFTAPVTASRTVVLSPQLPGRLAAIEVEVDQTVEKGQVLATLDDTLQTIVTEEAKLTAQREDEIELAKAAVADAELELEKAKKLLKDRAGNEYEVRKAELRLKSAQTELSAAQHEKRKAEIRLKLEMERLERHQIRAPFAGKILDIAAEPGATLSEKDPVLTLIAVDKLDAKFIVLPKELHDQLEVGRQYRLQAYAPVSRELVGTLKWIAPELDYQAGGAVRCEFSIDNADLKLKPGFAVRLIWPQDKAATAE